jgi:hypothetical protein
MRRTAMNTIYFDAPSSDEERRQRLYDGQLFVFSPCPSAQALAAFARQMAEEAFAPLDPREAQDTLPVEEYVAILAKLKPPFINHPQSKHYVQGILRELGCDLDKTYFDVPRLRTDAPRELSHRWPGLCLPPASRHLVLGAVLPD